MYVPLLVKACLTVLLVLVVPSPKFHRYLAMGSVEVDVDVKVMAWLM